MRFYAQTALPGFAAAGGFAGLYTYDILVYGGWTFGRICAEARALHLCARRRSARDTTPSAAMVTPG